MVSFHQSLHCSETWADSVMNSIMKIKQRKPTNKCFSEPTNIEHQGNWWKLFISYVVLQFKLDKDICYRNSLLDQDHQLHKIQLMSMMRDIMTIFWSNLFLTPKNIWCCDGKMNILCITTFTFYPTRETSSWCLHSTFTFTFYFSWRRDWCLLVGVCGNVCAISTNTSHYQPQSDTQSSDNQRPLITANANTQKCWRVKCWKMFWKERVPKWPDCFVNNTESFFFVTRFLFG